MLRFTVVEAEKYGFSVPTVLEYAAEHIDRQHIATFVLSYIKRQLENLPLYNLDIRLPSASPNTYCLEWIVP